MFVHIYIYILHKFQCITICLWFIFPLHIPQYSIDESYMCAQLFDDVWLALASCRRDPRMDELSSRFYDWGSDHGQLCNGEQTRCIYHMLSKMCLNEAIDIQYLKNVYFTTSSPATSRALLICFSDHWLFACYLPRTGWSLLLLTKLGTSQSTATHTLRPGICSAVQSLWRPQKKWIRFMLALLSAWHNRTDSCQFHPPTVTLAVAPTWTFMSESSARQSIKKKIAVRITSKNSAMGIIFKNGWCRQQNLCHGIIFKNGWCRQPFLSSNDKMEWLPCIQEIGSPFILEHLHVLLIVKHILVMLSSQ